MKAGPWTQPHADALGSVPGSEALMGKVLGPSVSDREGGKGVEAPSPWGRVQSLTHPSAKGSQQPTSLPSPEPFLSPVLVNWRWPPPFQPTLPSAVYIPRTAAS